MNPQEPQNRENPQTFVPDQQGQPSIVPLQNNAPATQIQPSVPVAQPVTPSQPPIAVSPTPVFNQSDALAVAKPKRRKKWLIVGGGTLLALIMTALVFVVLTATGIISIGKFKTVTYDNKIGNTFKLKYYSDYEIKSSPYLTSPHSKQPENKEARNLVGLGSNVSYENRLPIWFSILSDPEPYSKASKEDKDEFQKLIDCIKPEANLQKAFAVYIKSIEKDVNVCNYSLTPEADPIGYVFCFAHEDKAYVGSFETNVDFNTQDIAKQKEIIDRTKFKVYEEDMKKIVSSIQIINK